MNVAVGHFSKFTLVFDQGYDTTTLRYTWEGVPIGQEDVAKRNFNEYYVKSIKTTFGYASRPASSSSSLTLRLALFVLLPGLAAFVAYYGYSANGGNMKFVGDW